MLQPQLKAELIRFGQLLYMPSNEEEYLQLVTLLNELIDVVRDDENHPLAASMNVLGTLVADYESKHIPEPEGTAIDVIKLLMAEHGLKQKDLPEIGNQSVVSEVLNGNRALNINQIKRLSKRFNLNAAAFI